MESASTFTQMANFQFFFVFLRYNSTYFNSVPLSVEGSVENLFKFELLFRGNL